MEKRKHIWAMLLLVATCLFSNNAFAYEVEINGIYYNFNGDEAEVVGVGVGSVFSGDIIIPESVIYHEQTYSVTSIRYHAFYLWSGLTSVTIPNSVTSIGFQAFYGCSGLTSVTIGNSVTSIGGDAFFGCSGLKKVIVPDIAAWCGITFEMGDDYYDYPSNPLYYAKHLYSDETTEITNLIIPNSVTSIGNYAFYNCRGLTSVTIPNSVRSIGDRAFYSCSGLSSVTIGNSVTSIGESAFSGCSGLTSVTIGNSVTSIESGAFYGCSSLTSVTIPNSVTSIGDNALRNCSGLTSVTIGNSVTSIEYGTFSGCSGLTSVTIPNSVTSIGSYAFEDCSALTSVTIPNSVTSIGSSAFSGCSGLTSITIPNSVTSIGNCAFSGCSGLTTINVEAGNTVYDSRNNCNAIIETSTNTLIQGCKNTTIPNSVTSIGNYAFRGCSGLTSVTISNSITSIGYRAFEDCRGLTSVCIGNSVISLDNRVFENCKLRNVLIKCATPPEIDDETFSNQTLYHTTLYVPAGCWDAYAYDDNWYLFHNIRETVTTEEQVAMQQAYTLMDAETFTYSVYDPVNNCIGTIKSVSAIDENNPNHSWQVITDGSRQYLYNLGAKKFATNGTDGRLVLTAEPTPIDMENGDNGIVLGSQAAHQWALVGNDRLSVEQEIITGIDEIANTQQGESTSYDLQGRRIGKPQQGVNIIRNADGTTKKVLIKH